MSDDTSYYAARAIEERRLAMACRDPHVRTIHLDLAAKYAALAGANPEPSPPAEEQQRTG